MKAILLSLILVGCGDGITGAVNEQGFGVATVPAPVVVMPGEEDIIDEVVDVIVGPLKVKSYRKLIEVRSENAHGLITGSKVVLDDVRVKCFLSRKQLQNIEFKVLFVVDEYRFVVDVVDGLEDCVYKNMHRFKRR